MIYTGDYTLKINERAKIRTGWLRKDEIIYTGMPNENTYSLAITWLSSHNSMAYNIFAPVTQKEIRQDKTLISVRRVTPSQIEFSLESL